MAEPFLLHWYAKGAVPAAVTENVADWPSVTAMATGCVAIAGGLGAGDTESVASLLVTVPALFETETEIRAPLSDSVVGGVE
jgi:hypothetical protein